MRHKVFCYHLIALAGFAFQACSFNHSDISPTLESVVCKQSGIRLSENVLQIILFCDEIWIQRFTNSGKDDIAEIVSDLLIF